ncbi:MAG: glutamine synthetase III [Clostridia bacterium]|nr:glutamine synthetase III [Clostridia bacterium]
MTRVPEIFGSDVFNEKVMEKMLAPDVFQAVKKTIEERQPLDPSLATDVATAMKDWAIEKGATHYSHWFQPMTGITAEKHDSFITPVSNCEVIMEFKGKELIKGESDASSFPSGGLRATFEARGYTTWDPSSYAFVKDGTLYIPTVFCAFTGDILDKKTPLLRSMQALDNQARRVLKLFGIETAHVDAQVGAEQEYFLVDKELYNKRKDLIFTGRTLLGAKPPKGQEMDDHYFGAIKSRVTSYMKDLDETLWKLGVVSKTKHNEAAPAQHELAPLFNTSNLSTDQNQLMMEEMKRIAERHDMVCLLHEKPFAGVNGSGKHNNWSLSADGVGNLLKPGSNPRNNPRFLLFLLAVIKAVDEHQDLIRISVASASNDHRLGASEAPPAIVSIFLGEDLTKVLKSIERDKDMENLEKEKLELGVDLLPDMKKDTSDRNRTSPVAFTGNKFEFRMPGSAMSIACINYMINTIVADALSQFADRLEKAEDFEEELWTLLKETITKHKRILFNGNNYAQEWVDEAERRGLYNLKTTVDALPLFTREENIALFEKHGVLTRNEVESRQDILIETYAKTVNIEAKTLLDMARREVLPACMKYAKSLAESCQLKGNLGINQDAESTLLTDISERSSVLLSNIEELEYAIDEANRKETTLEKAQYFAKEVSDAMQAVRAVADKLETEVSAEYWPYPTYSELLFSL